MLLALAPTILQMVALFAVMAGCLAGFVFAIYRTAIAIDDKWGRLAAMMLIPVYFVFWAALFGGVFVLLGRMLE